MADPRKNPLKKQGSTTALEQSLNMMSPPQQAPITIYPGPSASMAGLSKADLEIAQRLEGLRKSRTQELPTEEEIASRLAQLKGLPSDHYETAHNSTAAATYQKPDTRSQAQKSDDFLQQVMEEVSLEANTPKPEDELEARLARLRGEEPPSARLQGAMALPPEAYHNHSQAGAEASLGEDLEDITMDEVEALMHAAEKETSASAKKALADLQNDQGLAQAVAQATRKKEKKGRHKKSSRSSGVNGDTSDEERRSKSYDSDIDIEGGKAIDAVTEQEEVQRIIDMYTKRAQLKKEKKRKKKEAAAAAAGAVGGAVGGEESDSDIEISSESDLSSDSEKFSDGDELSD